MSIALVGVSVLSALKLEGEVITTPFTFASTTQAIVRCGLTPVFCDVNEEDYTIDVDKISGGLFARSRLPEDKILLGGMHKRVKKLMCEKKIPVELRPKLPIICDDEGILAIPSVAVRDKARVGPQTENSVSLQITFAD